METKLKIKLQLSPPDELLEISGRCVIILLWILTIFAFLKMPDTIPTHFNASGQADNYGNKLTIFILPFIATIIFTGITLLNQHPEIFNYATKITEDNAIYQYSIATRMLRFLKLVIAIIFATIVLNTFLTSVHLTNGLGLWFLPSSIGLILIPTVYSIIIALKKIKSKKTSRNDCK